MAQYAGRDKTRVQRLSFWVAQMGDFKLVDLDDDRIHDALEGLATKHGRVHMGQDADGRPVFKAKRRPLSAASINRYLAALEAVPGACLSGPAGAHVAPRQCAAPERGLPRHLRVPCAS